MTYRDILVLVDDKPQSKSLLSAAIQQAIRCEAHLIGAFIKPPFIYPYMASEFGAYVPGDVIQTMMDDHAVLVRTTSQKAKDQFQALATEAGVHHEWRDLDGADNSELVGLARCTDLLVYPKGGMMAPGFSAADVTLSAGGPVLLVPRSTESLVVTKAVLAWNGSREVANALRGAWPILKGLELSVICVSAEQEAIKRLEQHISRHEITPHIDLLSGTDAEASELVQAQTKALGADLVVMGLYGRTRLQEFILGGVSRAMLHDDDPTLLLVAH